MKISELIKDLERVLANDGDIKTYLYNDGWPFLITEATVGEHPESGAKILILD